MPHYFFNVRTLDDDLVEDEDGVDLANVEAACLAAHILATRFAATTKAGGLDYAGCCFEVMREDGSQCLNVRIPAETADEKAAVIMLI
jgi:hypothetical protein